MSALAEYLSLNIEIECVEVGVQDVRKGDEMRDMRQCLIGMIGIVLFTANTQVARADRKVIVLIDASDSMLTPRQDPVCAGQPNCGPDPQFATRFDAAKSRAKSYVAMAGNASDFSGARVFIFHSSGAVNGIAEVIPTGPQQPGSPGWYTPDAVRIAIEGLDPADGLTPLAYSLCKAADVFQEVSNTDTIHDLQTFSDGGENNSGSIPNNPPPNDNCYQLDPANWQTKDFQHLVNLDSVPVQSSSTLFINVSSPLAARSTSANREDTELARLG